MHTIPGESRNGYLKKCCFLNIQSKILITLLLSAKYPIRLSFCRKPFQKACKNELKRRANFPQQLNKVLNNFLHSFERNISRRNYKEVASVLGIYFLLPFETVFLYRSLFFIAVLTPPNFPNLKTNSKNCPSPPLWGY